MKKTESQQRSDQGAILIFALIIITTVALVTGVVLAKGWGNFAATVALRNVAGQAYAADDAAKLAINDMVYGGSSTVPSSVATYPNGANGSPSGWVFDNNTDGTGCFGKNATTGAPLDNLTFQNVYPAVSSASAQTATVVCTPVFGTGLFGGGGGPDGPPAATDPFARALTTLGTGGSPTSSCNPSSVTDGITIKGLGSGAGIPTRGGIESKSFVDVCAGMLQSNSDVIAAPPLATNCVGSIISKNGSGCTTGFITPDTPSPELTSVPTYRDPLTQGCSFQPGFYNNATVLSSAVNACSTAYFASGDYYFDFGDNKPWDIKTTVVAGVSTGNGIPGACVSPINSPTTDGVQFVFGGSSQITVEDTGFVEICGSRNRNSPGVTKAPLTLFQLQSGSPPSTVDVPSAASGNVTTLTSGKNDPFLAVLLPSTLTLTPALAGTTVPNTTATWTSSAKNDTGELDLQNFAGLSSIPVGSTITSAKLNVTYTNGLSGSGNTFVAGVSGQTGNVPVASSGTDTDITALLNNDFAFTTGGFTSTDPTIQLQITGSNKGDTFAVDAASLTVSYTPPALRAATAPGNFITSGGNFKGAFVVQGATYAPNGYISLVPGSCPTACPVKQGLVAFRWGAIAWGVTFQSQPSQTWGYPLVSIPDTGGQGPTVTDVDLRVFLCTGAGPCPTTGSPALTSRVQFTDGTDSNGIVSPVAGQRQVQVLSWAEQR